MSDTNSEEFDDDFEDSEERISKRENTSAGLGTGVHDDDDGLVVTEETMTRSPSSTLTTTLQHSSPRPSSSASAKNNGSSGVSTPHRVNPNTVTSGNTNTVVRANSVVTGRQDCVDWLIAHGLSETVACMQRELEHNQSRAARLDNIQKKVLPKFYNF